MSNMSIFDLLDDDGENEHIRVNLAKWLVCHWICLKIGEKGR